MYNIYLFLRILFYPFFRYILPFLSEKISARVDFELLNRVQINALSKASYGFEVSSEGELEQVNVLIQHLLACDETVEIIYCSDSVEKQCLQLMADHPDKVRIIRLPIFTFNPMSTLNNPSQWLTCHTFFMCRYDFFPELINYGSKKNVNFILLSGAMKNFNNKNFIEKYYLKNCYRSFNKIVAVSKSSSFDFHKSIGISEKSIEIFDFRIPQILKRLNGAPEKINKSYAKLSPFLNYLADIPFDKKIIFGSFWNHETPMFKSKCDDAHSEAINFFLVPHKLDSKSLTDLITELSTLNLPLYELNMNLSEQEIITLTETAKNKPGVWVVGIKGLLCELYSYFQLTYIGGGFGESIHSVLEPYLSGNHIVCGPKTLRSSEFDMIVENNAEKISSVADLDLVYSTLIDHLKGLDSSPRADSFEHFDTQYIKMLNWLNMPILIEETDAK